MCIGDGSRHFRWTLTYQRQFLIVIQSGFAVRNGTVLVRSEWNNLQVELVLFAVCPISGGLQPTLFARNDWLLGKQLFYEYQNEKQHNECWNQLPQCKSLSCVRLWYASAIPHTKISSNSRNLSMSASQWPCKHVLIGDYFPNPDKRGSRYYRTCHDKAAYIISQAWLWSDS